MCDRHNVSASTLVLVCDLLAMLGLSLGVNVLWARRGWVRREVKLYIAIHPRLIYLGRSLSQRE